MAIVGIPSTSTPMDAFSKGFGLTDNLMSQILNRKELAQKADQFAKELAFRKQQEARLGANSDLTRQTMEQNLLALRNSNDPLSAMRALQAKLSYLQNMQGQGNASGQAMPQQSQQSSNFMDLINQAQGRGASLPQGQGAINPTEPQIANNQPISNIDWPEIQRQLTYQAIGTKAPSAATSPLGKAMEDLKQAKAMNAPPEQIQQMEQYAQRLAEGNQGVNLSVDPSTGAINFTSGGRGSQRGQQQVVNGQVISTPTMATSTDQQKLQLASVGREEMLKKVEQPYLGAGASFNMAHDLETYVTTKDDTTKKAAGDRLVKAAVSEKIVPEIANLQITSQGGKATVHALEKQEAAIRQGWPTFGKKLAGQLPSDLQKRVVEEHNQRLEDISNIRKKYFVKGLPVDLDDGKAPTQSANIEEPKKGSGKTAPITQEDKNYAKVESGKLIDVLPKATPENIISTAKQTGKSVNEVIDHLVEQAAAIRGSQ